MRSSSAAAVAACFVLVAATPLVHVPTRLDVPPAPVAQVQVEPPATIVAAGDLAPDVSWEGPRSCSRLRDLRAQGHVLLVFAPDEARLRALERERDQLLDLRVLPVAVLDRSASSAAGLARRLGLNFVVVPDPRNVVASQFNVLDPATHHAAPAWFVVDRWGRVRALDRRRVPEAGFVPLVSSALALAAPGAILPGSTR